MKWLLPVLLSVLLLEGLLRLVPFEPRIASHVAFDPELGHRGPRGARVRTPTSTLTFTNEGFRAVPVPPGAKLKVAILGDSFTEAFTIPDEKIFATLLARELHAQVRIYASGDWGTVQELLAYREAAARWQPDLVVLQFTAINDFLNNAPELAGRYQSRLDTFRPYLAGGEVVYLHPLLHAATEHSELARWLAAITLSWVMPRIPPKDPDCHLDPHMHGVGLYRVHPDDEWQRLTAETADALRALRREVGGTRLVGVFFPNPLELVPKLYGEVVEGQLHACYPQDPRPSPREGERKTLEAFRAAGIEGFSLFDGFAAAVKGGADPFIYDGHLSEAGHALAASLLAEKLGGAGARNP